MFRFWRRTESSLLIEKLMEDERIETAWQAMRVQAPRPAREKSGDMLPQEHGQPREPRDEEPLRVPVLLRVGGSRE